MDNLFSVFKLFTSQEELVWFIYLYISIQIHLPAFLDYFHIIFLELLELIIQNITSILVNICLKNYLITVSSLKEIVNDYKI